MASWRQVTSYRPGIEDIPAGHGQWLQTLPLTPTTVIASDCFRHGLRQRLGLANADEHATCHNLIQNRECGKPLGGNGQHASVCARGVAIQRHNGVRDLLLKFARSAGCQTHSEPRVAGDRTWAQNGRRPKTTADGHIITDNGADLWIDIRVATCEATKDIDSFLLQQEKTKCHEYGCDVPVPGRITQAILPIVMERRGTTSPHASFFLGWLQRGRARQLSNQGTPWSLACQKAQRESRQPLSAWLLKMDFAAHQQCLATRGGAPHSDGHG